mgnify:CR=1 FL=1
MSDDTETEIHMIDGDGNEIAGMIRVIKVINKNADDGGRPFHLEFDMSDDLWNEIVRYGSDVLNGVDLLHAGIRGAILETIARKTAEQEGSGEK